MNISNFKIKNRVIEYVNPNKLIGMVGQDKFKVNFIDEEWTGLHKTLKLIRSDGAILYLAMTNDEVELTQECYMEGYAQLGFFGTINENDPEELKIASTDYISIYFFEHAYSTDSGEAINVPTPTQWDIIIGQMNSVKDEMSQIEQNVENLAQQVSDEKDTVEQIKEDVQGLKSTIEQEIEDAEGVLDTYNANYEQKLNQFNDNFTQKKQIIDDDVSAFESDYLDKMEDLNTAGTEKVNAVNNAGSTQVGNINTAGATQMSQIEQAGNTAVSSVESAENTAINNIEILAEEKTAEFDEHTEEFQEQINTNSENIFKIQTDLELLESNFDPKSVILNENGLIEDALNWKAKYYSPIGKTSQNDDVSPDNPQSIENVIGDVKTETNNINFFDSKLLAQEPDYNTYDKSTGLWTTSNLGGYFRSIFYKVGGTGTIKDVSKLVKLKAGNYTIKFFDFYTTLTSNFITILLIDKDGNKISNISVNQDTKSISLEEDYYIDITRTSNAGTFSFSKIMIVEGTYTTNTFPSFVEHKAKNVIFPLSQGQKMYEGDYLADDGIHHVRGQVVFDGSEDEIWASRTNTKGTKQMYIDTQAINVLRDNQLCNYGKYLYAVYNSGVYGDFALSAGDNGRLYICVSDEETIETWKSKLAVNNLEVEYDLAQEEIDPYTSEQQTAWEELKELETYKGQTHIYTSSDGLSPDSKVTYLVNPLIERDSRLDALEQAVVALNSNN